MNKLDALEEARKELMKLPLHYSCVACKGMVPIEWEAAESSEDETDLRVEIRACNDLKGWCYFGGDNTCKEPRGLHCPACTVARRA